MYNDLFRIGSVTILHTYGLMTAVGILSAYFVAERRARKKGLQQDRILPFLLFCLIFGYAGSKLLYVLTNLPQILDDPSLLLDALALSGGWVIYGGIIGGIAGGALYCKIAKLSILKYFDLAAPSLALAQGFGRIGCFFAGCCYGVQTDSALSVTFTHSDYAPNGIPLVPTQIYSSIGDFLLFAGLILFDKKRKRFDGQITGLYLLFYSIGRFILEQFRGDIIRGTVGPLSTSQFVSIFTAAAGVLFLVLAGRRAAKIKVEKTLCVFDLDGTLLETVDSIGHPINRLLSELGYEKRSAEEYRAFVGDGFNTTVKRAFAAAGAPEPTDENLETARSYFREDPVYHVRPYDGIKELLVKLRLNGVRLAVLTNKLDDQAAYVIETFFGSEVFERIQGQKDGQPQKPDPACLTRLLEELRVERCDSLYIGDSDTDMQLAAAAGVDSVGVLWGYAGREELTSNNAGVCVEEPAEILPFAVKEAYLQD